MSVVFPINPDDRFEEYTATAAQTVFSVPFPFQDDGDIIVIKIAAADGAISTLTLTTHYTLSGAGTPGPGSMTLVTGAAAGDKFRIIGSAVLERLTSIVRDGRYSSRAQDDEHDRHRLVQQELARDAGRALKSDYGQTGLTIDITDVTEGKTLMRGAGNDIVPGPDAADIALAQGYAEDADAAKDDAEAALAAFRRRWVGDFADDAAADAFLTGAGLTKAAGTTYFNTTSDSWRYWDGDSWEDAPFVTVPDGSITAAKLAPDVSLDNDKLVEVSFTDDHTVLLTDAGKVLAFEKATAVEATLPALSSTDGQRFIFLNLGVGTLTVTPDGSDTIPGYSPLELPTGGLAELWISADEGTWRARVILPSRGDEWVHFPRDILSGGASWTKVNLDGFRDVSIRGRALSSAEPAAFVLEFSRDNGASWDTGSNYTWHRVYGIDTVADAASDGDTSDPSINIGLSGGIGAGGGEGVRFEIEIFDLSETLAVVQFQATTFSTSGLYIVGMGGGAHGGVGGARNGVRLRFTSGNMAEGYVVAKALA
ncbi:MAG: hypothetical protein CMF72_22665 [Mameliella sp.]|nr:hypothetical protein [Mameliella sp.]